MKEEHHHGFSAARLKRMQWRNDEWADQRKQERKAVLRYLRALLKHPAVERGLWDAESILRDVIIEIEGGKHIEGSKHVEEWELKGGK